MYQTIIDYTWLLGVKGQLKNVSSRVKNISKILPLPFRSERLPPRVRERLVPDPVRVEKHGVHRGGPVSAAELDRPTGLHGVERSEALAARSVRFGQVRDFPPRVQHLYAGAGFGGDPALGAGRGVSENASGGRRKASRGFIRRGFKRRGLARVREM